MPELHSLAELMAGLDAVKKNASAADAARLGKRLIDARDRALVQIGIAGRTRTDFPSSYTVLISTLDKTAAALRGHTESSGYYWSSHWHATMADSRSLRPGSPKIKGRKSQ